MPAAIQRFFIVPSRQCLTRPLVVRTTDHRLEPPVGFFTSAPLQKSLPEPRRTTSRTDASRSASRSASASSPHIVGSIAFFRSGRLSVIVQIPALSLVARTSSDVMPSHPTDDVLPHQSLGAIGVVFDVRLDVEDHRRSPTGVVRGHAGRPRWAGSPQRAKAIHASDIAPVTASTPGPRPYSPRFGDVIPAALSV